eukprot:9041225-Pyramimonas_sp.AAC.1
MGPPGSIQGTGLLGSLGESGGAFSGSLGTPWGPLGSVLETSQKVLGACWEPHPSRYIAPRPVVAHPLGVLLDRPGAPLGRVWGLVNGLGTSLRASWTVFEAIENEFGLFGPWWGSSWGCFG